MPDSFKLNGAEGLDAKLKALGSKVAKKISRKALRAGAKIVAADVRAEAPVKSGKTKAAVKVRAGKARKGSVSVLVSIGKKWFGGKTFYAAFVAFGHFVGKKLSGKFVGAAGREKYQRLSIAKGRKFVPANRYIEKAFGHTREAATEAITQTLASEIEIAAKEKP